MLNRAQIGEINRLRLPERYEIESYRDGLAIKRLLKPENEVNVSLEPFKSRGQNCRRVLAQLDNGQRLVLEFAKFDNVYEEIDNIIRAKQPIIEGDLLRLDTPHYRIDDPEPVNAEESYEEVKQSWVTGIRYNA
jgi:hypothetical protein